MELTLPISSTKLNKSLFSVSKDWLEAEFFVERITVQQTI